MAVIDDAPNIAIFCDYENIAIGAREARFQNFDITLAIERLLDKGKIVVKKAYADWERFKTYRRQMHESGFELIEIPHVSYSGKNSADIRLVVDALDLCYTKSHVDTFAIMSGDSDFSPLVSKLRENNKLVIGIGVKQSTSDLLVENCDLFIYYDDLVRKKQGAKRKPRGGRGRENGKPAERDNGKPAERDSAKAAERDNSKAAERDGAKASGSRRPADRPAEDGDNKKAGDDLPLGKQEEAIELVLNTVEALFQERDDKLWGSMVKQTLRRKRPNFNETFYGYRSFNQLLEDAQTQQLLVLEKDGKSGGYLIVAFGPKA